MMAISLRLSAERPEHHEPSGEASHLLLLVSLQAGV